MQGWDDQRIEILSDILRSVGTACELELPGGEVRGFGGQPPAFRVTFKNRRALRTPLTQYALARAYVDGDIDLEGDMLALFDLRERLRAPISLPQTLRFAAELFLQSPRLVNSRSISQHYSYGDDFYLTYIDQRFRFYSHCLFRSDDESLEDASEHKLESMWNALGLRPGMRLLDIGGGWGGVTEYCGARGVHVTSLTIAEDSANYIRNLIKEKDLPGEVFFQDVLDHEPSIPYDHAVIYGVIEHVPNYRRFCTRAWGFLKPGGRLYLDASATKEKYRMSTFARRYIWTGTISFMALQDIVEELLFHGFEIVDVRRETHDYELTMLHWARRLDANREKIVELWGEEQYRAFRIFLWGGCHNFKTNLLQAYHLVAERRVDPGPRPGNSRRLVNSLLALRLAMNDRQQLRDLDAFLLGIPLFAALDEVTRLELAEQLEPVHIAAGDVVLRQGDPGDGLFLVVSGRLRVFLAADGTERVLNDLGRGAIVGEIALLSKRPRSATVRAVRDSDLLLLRVSSFDALVERSPALLAEMARLLVDRLLTRDRLVATERPQAAPPACRTITVAPAGQNPRAAATVTEQLAAQLERAGSVFRVSADVIARHLGPGAARRGPGDPGRAELTGWLHTMERGHDYVIYSPDAEDTAWSRLCLSQSDVVLLAASAGDDPSVGTVEARALATGSLRCELVLQSPARPSAAGRWLRGRPVADHHHLRADRPGDVARLARMITGTGCGLVLGGGGARGLAHLGVIRALEEAGVPIDVVGGTSIGALMGALCAQGLDHAERIRRTRDIVRDGRRAFRPTLPLVAWSSGRRADHLLAEHLGLGHIEDLPLRFFCISANLTRAEEVIHERGPLWPAVRASLSLPGIFPPVYSAGDLLIDGGALDNVPVEVMRGRVGNGCIVAVDVSPEVDPLTVTPFEAGISGWRVLGRRLNVFAPPQQVPTVVDILSRSTGLSQVRHRRAARDTHRVDLLLRPPVGGVGTLDFKSGAALIKVGYRHAAEELAKSGLAERFVT